MRPRTIVDYEREPWIMDEGTVRIHLIQMSELLLEAMIFFDSTLPALSVLEPGKTDHGSEIYRDAASDSEKSSATAGSRIYSSFQICTVL